MALAIDTLAYVKKLMAAGVPQKQAEAQAEILADFSGKNLATKHDIELLRHEMEKMRLEMEKMKKEIVIQLGAIMAGGITILGILKYLP